MELRKALDCRKHTTRASYIAHVTRGTPNTPLSYNSNVMSARFLLSYLWMGSCLFKSYSRAMYLLFSPLRWDYYLYSRDVMV